MEVKKGYKQTEIGAIPDEWEWSAIGDVAVKVGSGITPTGGSNIYKESGRPFVRSQNVGWGELLLGDLAFITDEIHETFAGSELHEDDVLLNITGASIGRSAMASKVIEGGNVNQHVCIIRTGQDRACPRFVNAILLSSIGQRQIDSFQTGGNRQGLNFQQVRSIRIPLPPTSAEQQAIAEALSDADALIESLEQLVAKKRQIKHGAMQELLTGHKRLPGFTGEWKSKRFGAIVRLRTDRVDPRRTGPYDFCVELEHIEPKAGSLNGSTVAFEGASLKSEFHKNDVLFGKLRAYLRKFWLADRIGVCSTEIWVLVSNSDQIIPEYLFQIVTMDGFIELASTAYGTHMPRSDWNVIRNHEVKLPKSSEQSAIATILSDMDSEIATIESKLTKARLIKQGMMQELLTGRIRLV